MKPLSCKEVNHYITGAKVLACGGGGIEATAHQRISEVYDAGGSFRMVSLEEVPDDELLFIVGSVGGGVSKAAQKLVAQLPRTTTDLYVEAAQRLSKHLGREPFGFIATEIGPGNGVIPMYVAAKLGKVVIDGDCCGRAKPEIAISTTNLAGLSITPLSMVSPFGDFLILKEAIDDARAEVITRHVAMASGGTVGVARCPASGQHYRRAAIDGSVTRCIRLGQTMDKARAEGKDVVERILAETSGIHLFTGKVTRLDLIDAGGFTTGSVEMRGIFHTGERQRQEGNMRIWFKNEYLAVWFDDTPIASSPDSICVIDTTTGEGIPIGKAELRPKRYLTVFGVPAAPQWRTKKGIELFGPSHFQLPMEYRPIEN
ncbi:MAG: DUF917 domain-containing protein [Candidatus Odinarchaeota archaeon]